MRPTQEIRVVRTLVAPAGPVLRALGGNDATLPPGPDLFVEGEVRATLRGSTLELAAHRAPIPYFGWFFGPPLGRDVRRRLHHLAAVLDSQASGEAAPPPPRRAFWAPPAALSPDQAATMATLAFVLAVTGYAGSLLTQAIDPIARSFGTSDFQLGVLTGFTRVGALVALVGSALADRRGRRLMILVATGLAAAASLASAVAPSVLVLGVMQVLVRGSVNLTSIVCFIAATEEAPEGGRAWTLAVTGLAGSFGFVLGAALLPVTDLAPWAWRLLFAVGGLGLFFLPGISRRLGETRRYVEIAARTQRRGRVREVVDPIYGGRFLLLAGAAFLLNLFFAPSSQFTNRYLANERGFSGTGITLLRAVTQSIPALVAVYVGGRLAESRGRRPAAIGGVVVMSVTTAGFFLLGGPVLWAMLLASTAAAALAGPSLAAFNTELFPTEVRGTAGAALLVFGVAGSVVGLVAAGALSDPLGGIGPAVALTAAAPLLAAVALFPRLPEARGRELDEISPPEV
ncbi:MAG TPA: MFS transporter [Actinomycetota bacterium]|nr:MFS transporter [Actinomycetota bacterium]